MPEVRDTDRYQKVRTHSRASGTQTRIYLQDAPAVLDQHRTVTLPAGQIFGELAALGRVPRSATVLAATEARLLEIRWQGLRELRRYDPGWKRHIDENYRRNALHAVLQANPLFANLTYKVTFVGGTGRFANAKGTGTMEVTAEFTSALGGLANWTMKGVVITSPVGN